MWEGWGRWVVRQVEVVGGVECEGRRAPHRHRFKHRAGMVRRGVRDGSSHVALTQVLLLSLSQVAIPALPICPARVREIGHDWGAHLWLSVPA